ncbi:MAG: RNA polymerase sigma factor [Butyricicoccus sp.]|nr:RNA polymerase sigma factor [Butyricicoccus sp.]MBQ8585598.1 RNA polymerase sigma factor [Butyricicoccus sp.]
MLIYLALLDREADRSKFEKTYQLYRSKMLHTANRILCDRSAAEDVTHQAFLKIIENIEKIGEVDCPKTQAFVVIIAEHLAINEYHRRRRHPAEELTEWTAGETGMTPERAVSGRETVGRAIAGLPPREREVILLKYHVGYQTGEIAELLGVSEDAVCKAAARGKKRLAEFLREEGIEV